MIHHIFLVYALCFISQIDCNQTDVSICEQKALGHCSHFQSQLFAYEACLKTSRDQCFSALCHDHSVKICDSDPSCMIDLNQHNCVHSLQSLYQKKTICKGKIAFSCNSKLVNGVDEYVQCWKQEMSKCLRSRPRIRMTFQVDCEEQIAQEKLCFDIQGLEKCINVGYTFIVCYY